MGVLQLASCRFCAKQIGNEKAAQLSCGHLSHISCARAKKSCSSCRTSTSEYKVIKMRRLIKRPLLLSYLSPIPEESEWKHSKMILHDLEKVCQSRLEHSFSPHSIEKKPPKSIIKKCIKLFNLCQKEMDQAPEWAIFYSLQILWFMKYIRNFTTDIDFASKNCTNAALLMLEKARDFYILSHSQ